jgi:predicted O-methyltransferase YrrM
MSDQFEIVAAENQRLLREVRRLRARVAALESSRWWRLHPRFAAQRLWRTREVSADIAAPIADESPLNPEVSSLAERFRTEIVAPGNFSQDWFTGHISTWEPVMLSLEGRPTRVLELGSFEGLSACFLIWRLPEVRVTCVDTFAGSPEHSLQAVDHSELEDIFDRNMALVDGARARKIAGTSAEVLLSLGRREERFDLIYIDASHFALDVVVDAALAWKLVVPGGIVIFDDYEWPSPLGEDQLLTPTAGIDAFLELVGAHCEIFEKGEQVIIRKTAAGSRPEQMSDATPEASSP